MRRTLPPLASLLILALLAGPAGADDVTPLQIAQAQLSSVEQGIASGQQAEQDWLAAADAYGQRVREARVAVTRADRRLIAARMLPAISGDLGVIGVAIASRAARRAQAALETARGDATGMQAAQNALAWQGYLTELYQEQQRGTALVAYLQANPAAASDPAAIDGGQWAQLFLATIGAPPCQNNLITVVAWETAESTDAAWNPLATTLPVPGATGFNSVGVKDYASLVQGLEATRDTLLNGADSYGYGSILAALGQCADPVTTASYVNASAWCRGCAGGLYVLDLIPEVEAQYDAYASR